MLRNKKLFLLDIDGTICQGEHLIEGAKEFLQDIKKHGGQFVFITNNSTKSINDYIKKFETLGVMTDESNFVTASYATIQYLKKHYSEKLIYVMGTQSFIAELEKNNIRVTTNCDDADIACVLVAYDNELSYEKISATCKVLSLKQVDYLATNPDFVCPIEFGYVPDCGAICEMISHVVKDSPYFIGKPETAMVDAALQLNHYTKEETLVVGDRLYTDILCGINAGVKTALVLTGEATLKDVKENTYKPDYIFETIAELHKEYLATSI